jgi:hypothetical protein
MTEPETSPSRDERHAEAVASFLQALDAGQNPDPRDWLRRYPDVVEELTTYPENSRLMATEVH